jgi:hypothetical protein
VGGGSEGGPDRGLRHHGVSPPDSMGTNSTGITGDHGTTRVVCRDRPAFEVTMVVRSGAPERAIAHRCLAPACRDCTGRRVGACGKPRSGVSDRLMPRVSGPVAA